MAQYVSLLVLSSEPVASTHQWDRCEFQVQILLASCMFARVKGLQQLADCCGFLLGTAWFLHSIMNAGLHLMSEVFGVEHQSSKYVVYKYGT